MADLSVDGFDFWIELLMADEIYRAPALQSWGQCRLSFLDGFLLSPGDGMNRVAFVGPLGGSPHPVVALWLVCLRGGYRADGKSGRSVRPWDRSRVSVSMRLADRAAACVSPIRVRNR